MGTIRYCLCSLDRYTVCLAVSQQDIKKPTTFLGSRPYLLHKIVSAFIILSKSYSRQCIITEVARIFLFITSLKSFSYPFSGTSIFSNVLRTNSLISLLLQCSGVKFLSASMNKYSGNSLDCFACISFRKA